MPMINYVQGSTIQGPRHDSWRLPAAVGALAVLVVVTVALLFFGVGPSEPKWLPTIELLRPSLTQPTLARPFSELITAAQKDLVLSQGYGIVADCVYMADARKVVLRTTRLMDFDPNPELATRQKLWDNAGNVFDKAVAECNSIRTEKLFVFVDRTTPGVDEAVRERVRRVVLGSTILRDVSGRGNGLSAAIHSISGSVFDHDPSIVVLPPPAIQSERDAVVQAAYNEVDGAIQKTLSRPMGESRTALSTTIANVLTEGKPAAGDRVIIVSDYLENDRHTIQITRAHLSDSGEFRSEVSRAEIKRLLQAVLTLPMLNDVDVDLWLLPVASDLRRMMAMAKIFQELLEEKGAKVTIHID